MDSHAQIINEVNGLSLGSDDTIRFKGELIRLDRKSRLLTVLFLRNEGNLVYFDDIKDDVYQSRMILQSTISKDISKLRKILRAYFKKNVFQSISGSGYILKID